MPDPLDLGPLRTRLLALPQAPVMHLHPRHWYFRIKRATDALGHSRPAMAGFFRRINPYPKPFKHVWLETEDGIDIAGWYGPPPDDAEAKPAFGLVIVPGMFSTKDDTIHKRRAIHIWRHWKIPVLAIDTRAFGESKGISTGGWKEALDVHAAARYLHETAGVERVGVVAESLGGAAALNALAHDAESGADLMHGGTLCFSAFVDVKDAVMHISARPPRDDPFYVQWAAFRRMLRFRSGGAYDRYSDYMEDAARVNGLESFEELANIANPKWKTGLITQPVLLVHAIDDTVVPVRHARRMERYAEEEANIQVILTPWGGHTHFEGMEPKWFWEVMRRFFGTVNDVELPASDP